MHKLKYKTSTETIEISEGIHCKDCGWPIIHVCCNWDTKDHPQYEGDWWGYCSNKCCKHHEGESWFQNDLSFIEPD